MSNRPDPIRDIRTELINHADPIVRQAYEYIVDLELEHAQQKHDLEAEVERLRTALDKYQADDVRYLQARAKWRTEVERLTAQVEKWKWERHYWHEQYLKEVLGNTPEAQDE